MAKVINAMNCFNYRGTSVQETPLSQRKVKLQNGGVTLLEVIDKNGNYSKIIIF